MADPQAHPELSITLCDSPSQSKQKPTLDFELEQLGLECAAYSRTPTRPDEDSIESMHENLAVLQDLTNEAFMEAVLANHSFLQAFTAQEILSIKSVSKLWATWFRDNINTIALARREDESVDWYFPLLDKVKVPVRLWQMIGLWHAGAEYSSETKLCKLPQTSYLLSALIRNNCICDFCKNIFVLALVASGGGLLMFKTGAPESRCPNVDHSTECVNHVLQSRSELMVTNPLTKQCKVLLVFEGGLGHTCMSSYYKHHHFIVVDDKTNTYKVLVFWCSRLDVYDSKSNTWKSFGDILSGLQPSLGTWGTGAPDDRIYSAVCMDGCLYVADIREATNIETSLHPEVIGAIRLFKVEIETGESKLCNEILVCIRVTHPLQFPPVDRMSMLHNLELVETLGQLYAIIPARLDHLLYVYKPEPRPPCKIVKNLSFMPLQFFIFCLTHRGSGVIRMEVPKSQRTTPCIQSLSRKTFPSEFKNEPWLTPRNNWFACMAKGRVIWLIVEDYLVQYDMLTRECKTEFLDKPEGTELVIGLPYRASFHMEP